MKKKIIKFKQKKNKRTFKKKNCNSKKIYII